ncbi:MAG TPA: TonB family protein [Rhodoferax sp.]|nr:TonB family protein [Rhodoferax sp.]HNV58704.1 TonB family protein [Rhodoferax sp.]HPW29129.1 TonB family protein [Rhodoferax sp.]
MVTNQTPPEVHSRRAAPLAWLGAIVWATAYTPVCAQSPDPAAKAAQSSAMERSQRQADNVYRWIKLHADAPRKVDPTRVRPKNESPNLLAGKLDNPSAEPVSPQTPPPNLAEVDMPITSAQAEALLEQSPTGAGVTTRVDTALAPAPVAPVPEVETALKAIEQPQPEFPRDLRNTITQGKVLLAFTVQPDGTVSAASVLSATNRKLSKPALEAVTRWRFEPIRMARATQVEIAFDLQ